ncbi:outer membrane beta-barrel protein [Rhizobium sp. KVB221]|uniref:Outer membrane beta-barrel protein n=1 Tax=Rhizobium setariae TaxID=2801340 RepID=A0A936YK02_9HYPH|nr:outer membrane beta-barrel protein [Rhizobium setariae]MBL0371710.1 outer membrane beta-barrel protein [Rhizobium setariae]
MKCSRSSSDLVRKGLPAIVLAVQIGMLSAPEQSWAQSALDPSSSNTQLRLSRPSNATTDNADGATTGEDAEQADAQTDTPDVSATEESAEQSLDAATLGELRQQNPREESIDGLRSTLPPDGDLAPGVALGAFTLRPTISERLGMERTRTGKNEWTRSYLETGLKGSLVSDWSQHELRIDAEGTWQKTLSGIVEDDPEGRIDAAFRLDISHATLANLKAGYSLQREDVGDANAISGATNQALVSTYIAGAEVVHDMGLIRGTVGVDFERQTYGDAQLANGTFVSQEDRNENTAILRGRIGYELSPALIPFLEASYGQSIYDQHRDDQGYVRDATIYAVKTGIEADFGEKLRGELSTGYTVAEFEDPRLDALSAITFDGNATWSPRRGTDATFGLRTALEPSTTAGASGSIAYTTTAELTQAIIDELTGRLATSITWRDYSQASVSSQTVYNVGAGLTWGLSQSIDLNADATWERTRQSNVPTSDVFTAGIGIALKR